MTTNEVTYIATDGITIIILALNVHYVHAKTLAEGLQKHEFKGVN